MIRKTLLTAVLLLVFSLISIEIENHAKPSSVANNPLLIHKSYQNGGSWQAVRTGRKISKSEFLEEIKKLSNIYKDGMPEERMGIAYFKGNTRCITCHNSLDKQRAGVYLSNLMQFNRKSSEVKFSANKIMQHRQLPAENSDPVEKTQELIRYIVKQSDIKWSQMDEIPGA